MAEPIESSEIASSRRSRYLFLMAGAICTFLFFYPVLVSGKAFYFRDLQTWLIPQKALLAGALKAGTLPFWNSHTFCGSPFLTDLQSGVFYLPSVILVVFPFPWSFNLYVVLHFFIAFYFFCLFTTSLGLSRWAGIVAAIAFCFGGYVISSLNLLNQLTALVWLPAVLWSYTVARTKNKPRYYFLTVLFMSLSASGGEPQHFAMAVGVFVLYSLFAIPGVGIRRSVQPLRLGLTLSLIVATVFICAVQFGPAYLDYRHSIRSVGFPLEHAAQYAVSWEMLRHLVVPLRFPADYLSHPPTVPGTADGAFPYLLTLYTGFLSIPLAVVGLIAFRRKGSWLWLVAFLVGVILAVGTAAPVFGALHRVFPVIRFPSKFMFPAGFGLAVLVACGYDAVERYAGARGIRPWMVFVVLGGVMLGDLFLANRHLNPVWPADRMRTVHPDLAPLASDASDYRVFVDRESLLPAGRTASYQDFQDRQQGFLAPNTGVLGNMDYVDGTTALELRFQYMITEVLARPWPQRLRFLRLAGVKYIVSLRDLTVMPEVGEQVERVSPSLYRLRDPLPRAWIVGRLSPISPESMRALGYGRVDDLTRAGFTPSNTAWAVAPEVRRHTNPFHAEVDELAYEGSDRIRIRTSVDRSAVLFLAESFYDGWRVFVDGQEAEVLWLNLLFQGVELASGNHEVVFRYRPEHFDAFLGVSAVSTLVLAGLLGVVWRRRR